jgi:hypothetical protein
MHWAVRFEAWERGGFGRLEPRSHEIPPDVEDRMNRIVRTVKQGVLVSVVALIAAYFGASTALQLTQNAVPSQGNGMYLLVDDPVPCPKC